MRRWVLFETSGYGRRSHGRRARVLAERAAEGAVASPDLGRRKELWCVGGCVPHCASAARTPFLAFASLATLRAQCDSLSESVPAGVPNVSVRVLLVMAFGALPVAQAVPAGLQRRISRRWRWGRCGRGFVRAVAWCCGHALLCSPATDWRCICDPRLRDGASDLWWWGTATTLWALFATRVCTTPPSFVDFSLPNSCGRGVCWRAGKPDASPVWGDRERVPEACGETRCRCV
ncbi:hypothetical protein TcBrA4_0136040 [Trypanosoma cruzi]|nr:hypothetical protein TcBrA4_0136040 [Trypanosoma cruzi]